MASLNVQLQGFVAANRDATVKLVNQATGAIVERKPFLDGSLLIRDLDPGPYELEVRHPNLTLPIDKRPIRIFPQIPPTYVPIPIKPDLFRDTPIRDIPDADLAPVQQTATAVRDRLKPIAAKGPGEAIRAADWNMLVGAVSDLASSVLELTRLVAPQGHNHPEIAEKIDEVQSNIRRFAEAFGRSLVELRREIENEDLRKKVVTTLDLGQVNQGVRDRVIGRITELETLVQSDTPAFTQKLASTGNLLLAEINQAAAALSATNPELGEQFRTNPTVTKTLAMARQYAEAGVQSRPESELQTYQKTTTVAGGKFKSAVGNFL
jgi:hypothetical protein